MSQKEILHLESQAGTVELSPTLENDDFGFTLYEGVTDPANPEGPTAIGMHVPENSMSKLWQLVELDYSERVELLSGTASLVVMRGGKKDEWTTIFLTAENPTGSDFEIKTGDAFCIVTGDEAAVVLSRPSQEFDISFEQSLTDSHQGHLARFVMHQVSPWARYEEK